MNMFDRARPPVPFPIQRIQRTPTGARLQDILNESITRLESLVGNKELYQQEKPFDIILLTDGLPDDDPRPVIENAWARLQAGKHHPNYVGVQIVQVGNDPEATAKLRHLKEGNIGSIVDTVPYDGGELTFQKLTRIVLGAVQPSVRQLYTFLSL
ncbi:hypothetical protein AX15_007936 [Amanita polypyramis BW_CC]|nr:hypothetical protein AX15_007936 [Amanita polypyramis BW_CC]